MDITLCKCNPLEHQVKGAVTEYLLSGYGGEEGIIQVLGNSAPGEQ
ncbi:hypothetical protein [Oceanimonas baumannii]|nr:hypothetical protein [Oceanimonas baumannii]